MKQADLNNKQQAQLDEAKELVERQQYALDQLKDPFQKLVDGKKLNRREELVVAETLRMTDEERAEFESLPKNERQTRYDSVMREPHVFFYVGPSGSQKLTHRVYVTPNGVEFHDEDHPEF